MSDVCEYLRALSEAEKRSAGEEWPAAAALWDRVTEANPVHGGHWARLGQARFELGDFSGALAAYEQAQRNGIQVPADDYELMLPAEMIYRMAVCELRLGHQDAAAAGLRRAVAAGLRDLDRPRKDEDWAPVLAGSPQLRELLGVIDRDGLSRTEGWRADLKFLAGEIRRRAYAPFAEVSEQEFAAAVASLSDQVPELSDFQIIAGIMRLLRPLGDGHAFVIPDEEDLETRRALPVKFYQFTEGVFVTAASSQYRELLGAQLVRFGDRDLDGALAEIEPLVSRDNPQQVTWIGTELLRWTPLMHALGLVAAPGRAELTVRLASGSTKEVCVESVAVGKQDYPSPAPPPSPTRPRPAGWTSLPDTLPGPMPLYLRNCDVSYWFEYLADSSTVYFQFNGVGDEPPESLAAFCERLFTFIDGHQVDRLVIDLRWNGGGNTYLVQPLLHRLVGSRKINQRGSLYVIVGRGTFSAAQNTSTAIERETNAIFVGEPSGSRPNFIGETIPFTLPYSKAMVNVADLYWQTSWPMDHRPWIAPDLYAPPSFEAYSHNLDPAMEAILGCREHLPGW
jgi:tetratricopeptide (TPR) repeat protein